MRALRIGRFMRFGQKCQLPPLLLSAITQSQSYAFMSMDEKNTRKPWRKAVSDMARYIDAEKLEEGIFPEATNWYQEGWNDALKGAMLAIPTDSVAPRAEWISVQERLPDNCRAVLVALEGLTIGGAPAMVIGSYSGGFWMVADADGTHYLTKYMRYNVTHWMPLPEPPKNT